MQFSLCNIALITFVAFSLCGCGEKEKKNANKIEGEPPAGPAIKKVDQAEEPGSAADPSEATPQFPACQEVCGGGECVLPVGGTDQGYCAVNGEVNEEMPCGAGICEIQRSSLDCHDYCREQALSSVVDDTLRGFMASSGTQEGNIEGAYTGYCQTEMATPQCSGSLGFCTANQCNLVSAKKKMAEEGKMCAFSWEGSSFTQSVPGAAASVIVQYAGPAAGWVIHSIGCEYQGQDGASGYKITGPNQVSQCLTDIEAGVSQLPAMAQFTAAFGMEMQKLDITLPAQGRLSNVLRGSQFLVSCAQVLLKVNSQYTFNFLTAYNGGVAQGTSAQSQNIQGFRAVSGQYSVSNFQSRAVTVDDYMLMYREVGTKMSAMCFDNVVQQFCTQKATCRADGLLKKKNTVILEKDLKEGGNYRITGLECADLKQQSLNFDEDRSSWDKINLYLAKYLGNVPADRKRALLNRIQTSFHPSLAEGMMTVGQMAAQRQAYTDEVRGELESSVGLSRFIAGSAAEHEKLSSCSRVYQDWASGEDMQFYIEERLKAEMKTGRLDASRTHMKERVEQRKIEAAHRAYKGLLGHNLYESLSPAFARALEKGETLAANNDAGLMADIMCSVAVKALDEPTTFYSPTTQTCTYTGPNIEGTENTLYISRTPAAGNKRVSSAVSQAKMMFGMKGQDPNVGEVNAKIDSLLKQTVNAPKANPRDIVHPARASDEEASTDVRQVSYNVLNEAVEEGALQMEIIGVTCGPRFGDLSNKWRSIAQSITLEQLEEGCVNSDLFESWGYDNGSEQTTLKQRFKDLITRNAGVLQVDREMEGDFCLNVEYDMFSNYRELSAAGNRRSADLKKTAWSTFLSIAIPRVYAENQGPTSLSQVLDAPMAADVLCTIAWGCDLLTGSQSRLNGM